jgi:hypothetical protein
MSEGHTVIQRADFADIAPCSTAEALRRDLSSIELREGEEAALSPSQREHHKYFARVRMRGFDDLQALGLVPRRLKEQVVRDALSSDDRDALQLSREFIAKRGAPAGSCGCESAHIRPTSIARELDATYRDIRKEHHPALARVLSERYETEFAWNSAFASSIYGWTRRIQAQEIIASICVVADITIGRNATLTLDHTSTVLLAREIWIHRTGKLVHRGGFLRIWAKSLDSFRDLSGIVHEISEAPWRLTS